MAFSYLVQEWKLPSSLSLSKNRNGRNISTVHHPLLPKYMNDTHFYNVQEYKWGPSLYCPSSYIVRECGWSSPLLFENQNCHHISHCSRTLMNGIFSIIHHRLLSVWLYEWPASGRVPHCATTGHNGVSNIPLSTDTGHAIRPSGQ